MLVLFNSKTPQYKWLSNFYNCPLTVKMQCGEMDFECAEAAYQCAKMHVRTPATVERWQHMDGLQAKEAGKHFIPRDGWDLIKLDVMSHIIYAKFQDSKLRFLLRQTLQDNLMHLSPWDTFWGVDKNLNGQNHLGLIIMSVREELK